MSNTDKTCPVTDCLETATDAAKGALGTDASNKRVKATSTLSVAVTENGKTNTQNVDASVALGVSSSESDAAPACCCADSACEAGCCCKKSQESK